MRAGKWRRVCKGDRWTWRGREWIALPVVDEKADYENVDMFRLERRWKRRLWRRLQRRILILDISLLLFIDSIFHSIILAEIERIAGWNRYLLLLFLIISVTKTIWWCNAFIVSIMHRYEPDQDSFLFLDSLEKEFSPNQQIDPYRIVEIGPGSSIISTFLTRIVSEHEWRIQWIDAKHPTCINAIDINKETCRVTKETFPYNGIYMNEIIDDFDCIWRINSWKLIKGYTWTIEGESRRTLSEE